MEDTKVSIRERQEEFHANILAACRRNETIASLKVDLVFFIMLRGRHFYLVVFNLKKPSFLIIDNINHTQSIEEVYGIVPETLHSLFCNYLREVHHPKAYEMLQLQPEIVDMDWRTKKNFVDCGVFAMRHMETFFGSKSKDWKCGLVKEGTKNKAQFNFI
ncbi:Peptidase C48, SUMO/Sentrin/Ubl1, partial [Cynara cardunculus var. scolymus]